ncbi:MAG: hypothetical protein LBM95_04985 [Lactobacillales bacterium]|jgi:hypothetical protein|nr:hypothetical protein [Lactobacillales bacterium]
MEEKKATFKKITRHFFLTFLEDFDPKLQKKQKHLDYLIKQAIVNKSYVVFQIESEEGLTETVSGWIVTKDPKADTLMIRLRKEGQFHMIKRTDILKISAQKRIS